MKYELAQMKSQGFGAIVNVGSDAGPLATIPVQGGGPTHELNPVTVCLPSA
jgi:hypothetical protein